MQNRSIKSGDLFLKKEDSIDNIWYISSGRVAAVNGALEIILKKGDFIGLSDFDGAISTFDYYAEEEVNLIQFCSRDMLIQSNFFASKPENSRALALSLNHITRDAFIALNQLCNRSGAIYEVIQKINDEYLTISKKLGVSPKKIAGIDELSDPVSMMYSHKCLYQYHKGTSLQLSNKEDATELIKNLVIPGYMIHAASDLADVNRSIGYVASIVEEYNELLFNDSHEDFMEFFNDLYIQSGNDEELKKHIMEILSSIYDCAQETPKDVRDNRIAQMQSKNESLAQVEKSAQNSGESVTAILANSMDKIMEYAGFAGERASAFKSYVENYKNLADPSSTEDDARRLRKDIEKAFYELYLSALGASVDKGECPTLVKMFLLFGYLDEELAGIANAVELYEIAKTYHGEPEKGVFTGYEWLLAIYNGAREPSINEFDQTYDQFIKEQADNGRIPREDYKAYLSDRAQMVMFELQNMFRSSSRICSGRIINFCPIFSEHQILRSAKEDLLTPQKVIEERDSIRNIDYTIFYREKVFVYDKKENVHDIIHIEVLPDIVMMPVVGSRGSMWQEISGRDRMSPARMMIPTFDVEDLNKALVRIFAEYRWEMCKRIQGARWNDVTDPSLTSLYYDYLQFYRKNSQISIEQKEKIKIGLQKNRNSYKEFFISDYTEYVKFESMGSPHLIRYSRTILYAQCPFSAAIRGQLASNPIFSELNDRYKHKVSQQLHKLNNIEKKLASKGRTIPKELEREKNFYSI